MNWKLWSRGLFAAVINAVTTTVASLVVDPEHWSNPKKLGLTALTSGIVGAALYLKQHPLPGVDVNADGTPK